MSEGTFSNYLLNLGFDEKEIQNYMDEEEKIFDYIPPQHTPSIKYIRVDSEEDIFLQHKRLWNRNSDNVFIAIASNQSHLINVKEKPDFSEPLKKSVCLESFNYGINTDEYQGIDSEIISKNYINSTYFYNFIQTRQREKQEVDEDLLLNLLALRNDLLDGNNERIIHLLILRCLFVKYLEDRGIFENKFISNKLSTNSPIELIKAFDEVCKINGDVFGENRLTADDIRPDYLGKLKLFFNSDYRSGQYTLFPYEFDCIPIQLISHVYEIFLKNAAKKGKGIYYTPSFVVDFILSQSLKLMADENPEVTVLDPAVGSGAFLVESFRIIRDSHKGKLDFDAKKRILQTQLFGIDTDGDALQITAFSLYLALLEDEKPEFIKEKIKNAHPILPGLIGNTLIQANSITDPVLKNNKFDFIVSNPPWGSVPAVPAEKTGENIKEREALDNKDGNYPEYAHVADYERSQAFLMLVGKWQKKDSLTAMIVKNSIFLNNKTEKFRKDFLNNYKLDTFYELSHYNKILFKKRVIGKINGKPIELGTSEPCAIVIYKNITDDADSKVKYISPKLTRLAEYFELIQHTSNDSFAIKQDEFLRNDLLWKILVNGDFESYELIKTRILPQKEMEVEARSGFQPKTNMKELGNPIWKDLIEPNDFEQYLQRNTGLRKFNWNQELHRKREESIFQNSRIIVPVRPLKDDKLMFRGICLDKEIIHKDNILSIKLKSQNTYIKDCLPYSGIFNSMLIGFTFYNISSQWGKGEGKRATLRNVDIESLPIKNIESKQEKKYLTDLIKKVQEDKSQGKSPQSELNKINDIVFDLYGLLDYEKELIREFYQIYVDRANPELQGATDRDMQAYFSAFKDTFSLILSPKHTLTASYYISANVGAVIKITIIGKEQQSGLETDSNLQILNFVKSKQINETDKLLREEKVKIYEQKHFYIVKSNQFKDWTKRQAIKDAKEEIEMFLKHLCGKG